MLLSAFVMRMLLALCLLGTAVLAVLYLRQRRMSRAAYLAWGLLAILLPLVGPFVVMTRQPGRRRIPVARGKPRRRHRRRGLAAAAF